MPRFPSHSLAKLTRPRLHNSVDRERLFRLMDGSRERQCIWVSGPPGAGKTSMVASYLNARGATALWYRIDPADGDPASFFYYLREAAIAHAPRLAKRLPLFTPEYRDDLRAFARRFFRDSSRLLGDDSLLVFDNFQELPESSPLHATMAACLEEIPAQVNVVIISRTDPPAAYARALINGLIVRIDWESLRLTRAETQVVAEAYGIDIAADVAALHDQCSGWIAGLVLMAERLLQTGDVRELDRSESLETVFDYFAGQILDTAGAHMQYVLVCTSLLPHVTEQSARAVTGLADAIQHVEQMFRRRLFTDRTQGAVVNYRYHALFRTFLQARSRTLLSGEERTVLLERAAASCEQSGDAGNAIELYVEAGRWMDAQRVFVARAPAMIGQGRWKTLQEWHARLSASDPRSNPWVEFWLGRALSAIDPPGARACLETAFDGFVAEADQRGQLLCGIGILETLYYQYEEFLGMDRWIERTAQHLERQPGFEGPEEELWVNAVFTLACCFRRPGHPLLEISAQRVDGLLPRATDVNLKVTAATMLLYYGYTALDARAVQLAIREARPLLASDQLTAERAALYLGEEGYSHYAFARYQQALACFDEADLITRRNGLPEVEARICYSRGFCQRRAGMLKEARDTVRRLEQLPRPRYAMRACQFELLRGYIAFDEGDHALGLTLADPTHAGGNATQQIAPQTIVLMYIIYGSFLVSAGRFEDAAAWLDRAQAVCENTIMVPQRGSIALMRAWLALRRDDREAYVRHAHELLALSRGERELVSVRWYPKILAEVLERALQSGLDREGACRLIRQCSLTPVGTRMQSWPWAVKIRTLGAFELLLDGHPPQYSRKTPKRVLTLLKTLIAFGGSDVPEDKLIDALWPDLDGDAAHKALAALVHRLRALLGDHDAVLQRNARLSLNPGKCWVDVLELTCAARSPASGANDAAIALYGGPFLAGDDEPWLAPMREKARACHLAAVQRQGAFAPERLSAR